MVARFGECSQSNWIVEIYLTDKTTFFVFEEAQASQQSASVIIEPARCILTHDLWSIIIIELPLVPLFVDWRRQVVPSPIDGVPSLGYSFGTA